MKNNRELKEGIENSIETLVSDVNTAKAMGSGTLDVFATPAMVALMEETCWKSVQAYLEEDQGSVGTKLDISHVAATPVGMTVRCESELIKVDGRRLVFSVKAFDEVGLVGEGTHERFIVDNVKFQNKADAKINY